MRQICLLNIENVTEEEIKKYWSREAARAVIFDEENNIALIHATKNGYYKLPGGGIEKGETNEEALKRECKEEIGCNIEITGEIGMTLEYRKKYNLKQTSHCYTAKLVGEKGTPTLEPDEIAEGFEVVWLPLNQALAKIKASKLLIYEAQYMVARDTVVLETLKK